MKGFVTTRIGRNFLAIFLALTLPLIAVGWFGLRTVTSALERQTHAVLRAASNAAEAQLREFLLHLKRKTLSISVNAEVRDLLQNATDPKAWKPASDVNKMLAWQQTSMPDIEQISVLSTDGRVVASSKSESMGENWSSTEFFARGQKTFFPGDIYREPTNGRLRWVMAAPIMDVASSRLLGIVALRVNLRALNDLTTGRRIVAEGADTQSFRIGNTGETYIVNRDRLMITESRDLPGSVLEVKVDTSPVRVALEQGREFSGDYEDYRGERVSGASVFLSEMNWIVLTEIDFSQVFAPIRRLRNVLILLVLGLALSATLVTGRWARSIVRPLRIVGEADVALGRATRRAQLRPKKTSLQMK